MTGGGLGGGGGGGGGGGSPGPQERVLRSLLIFFRALNRLRTNKVKAAFSIKPNCNMKPEAL